MVRQICSTVIQSQLFIHEQVQRPVQPVTLSPVLISTYSVATSNLVLPPLPFPNPVTLLADRT